MRRITYRELLELSFGSEIRIIWHNLRHQKNGVEEYGVIFGNKIGFENGLSLETKNIAKSMRDDLCMCYLITE